MTQRWFTCKIGYSKPDNDGIESKVTEMYLVNAFSYTEAEGRMYQIIQEELQSHLGQMDLNGSQEEAQIPAGREADGAVAAAQRDFVLGKLDYYSSVGSISSAEMAQLQMEIAKLDESGRTEMMSRLNRPLNSGALKGNL